jgi:hypothetical protein
MPSTVLDLEQQGSNASESAPKPRRLSDQATGETPSRRSQIAWNSRRCPSPCGISPSWPGASPRDALMAEEPDAWQWHRDIPGFAAHRGSGKGGHTRHASVATHTGKGGRPRVPYWTSLWRY